MPFDMGTDHAVERIERLDGLSGDEREKVLGGNARRLLSLV
jgi:hypothetical protein